MEKDLKKERKMKFHDNRYTVADDATKSRADNKASRMPINCASKRKLNQLPSKTIEVDDSYNIIINFETLKSFWFSCLSGLWQKQTK